MSLINFETAFETIRIPARSSSTMVDFFVNQKGKKQIIVEAGASLLYVPILIESELEFEMILDGVGASLICSGLAFSQTSPVRSLCLVRFMASKTTADVQLLGLPTSVECRLEGDLDIAPGIEGVVSSLYQHQLIRGNGSVHLVALPKLHVQSHQVKAGHGASIHQLDPKYLFYLMAKGLNLEVSQKLVVDGHIEHLLDRAHLSDEDKSLVMEKLSPLIK